MATQYVDDVVDFVRRNFTTMELRELSAEVDIIIILREDVNNEG